MKSSFWKGKRVLVTGGNGFLGSHLVKELKKRGAEKIITPRKKDHDLRNKDESIKLTKNTQIVIHLAGNVGGIGYNQANPYALFYDNLLMGLNVIDACRHNKVDKIVIIGTVCSYPKHTPVPFKESDLWNGYPEETNAPYGIAKKALLVQSLAYKAQFGLDVINLLPVNLYGPGDNFDPSSSHVIPSLIKKFHEAKIAGDSHVTVWGTGKASREFFYVEDAARAIADATEKCNQSEPINIGTGSEIKIKKLVEMIKKIVGYHGRIVWDKTKPDGQPRRMLDTSRARKLFGFQATTNLETGLRKTIEWYKSTFA